MSNSISTPCNYCGRYGNRHLPICAHYTLAEAIGEISELSKSLKAETERRMNQTLASDKTIRRLRADSMLWQAKFHQLRHENNKLRNKLYKKENPDA